MAGDPADDDAPAPAPVPAALDATVTSTVHVGSPPPPPPRRAPAPPPADRYGRFQVVDQLGEGGMGVVYKAYDPELGRLVAIKRVRDPERTAGGAARLVREAQAAAKVVHPNVVAVFDVGQVGDDVFIAMEYVDGWRLREWLAAARRGQREILDVFTQAAAGLAAAHDRGLVHRDFKPHNVLVGYDGRVRVVDFGLARPFDAPDPAPTPLPDPRSPVASPLTPAGVAIGTPRYMAPEQHLRRPLDGRADQFAFCVALYEALVGAPPFEGRDLSTLGARVVRGEIRPIPRDAGVPRWLRSLLLRGLAPDPAARFASMHDLLAELTQDHGAARRAALGTEPHTERMLAAFPPPDDETTAARVRELFARLERARGRKERGALADARALAEELVVDLGDLDYLPLRAATLYLAGELRHKTGDHAGARAALEAALDAAAGAGDDWQLAAAWVLLVLVVGVGLARPDEAELLARAADVACRRVGDNPSLRARLHVSRGLSLLAAGRPADAAAVLAGAVALDEATYGPRHWFVAVSLLHLGEAHLAAGDRAAAHAAISRAAAICRPDLDAPSPTRDRCRALLSRLG
jgi:predicted Ser/Thr protein kinase/tetratricopeptide (TPR) repeat protein